MTEAFGIEMFVTVSFPLAAYAAVASPEHGMSRRVAFVFRWGAIALFVLCVVLPVYKIFGFVGLAFFCYLVFATYSGWFVNRSSRADGIDMRRVLFPLVTWWSLVVAFVLLSVLLNAVGIEAGEVVSDDEGEYHSWPAGWVACGTVYFTVLAWLELTGAYDPGSLGRLGALLDRGGGDGASS